MVSSQDHPLAVFARSLDDGGKHLRCRTCGSDKVVIDVRCRGTRAWDEVQHDGVDHNELALWCTSCDARPSLADTISNGAMSRLPPSMSGLVSGMLERQLTRRRLSGVVFSLVAFALAALVVWLGNSQYERDMAFLAVAAPATGTVTAQWTETSTDSDGNTSETHYVRVSWADPAGQQREFTDHGRQAQGTQVELLYDPVDFGDARLAFTADDAAATRRLTRVFAGFLGLIGTVALLGHGVRARRQRAVPPDEQNTIRLTGTRVNGVARVVGTARRRGKGDEHFVLVLYDDPESGRRLTTALTGLATDPRADLRGSDLTVDVHTVPGEAARAVADLASLGRRERHTEATA